MDAFLKKPVCVPLASDRAALRSLLSMSETKIQAEMRQAARCVLSLMSQNAALCRGHTLTATAACHEPSAATCRGGWTLAFPVRALVGSNSLDRRVAFYVRKQSTVRGDPGSDILRI
jgi:hypothetical protein